MLNVCELLKTVHVGISSVSYRAVVKEVNGYKNTQKLAFCVYYRWDVQRSVENLRVALGMSAVSHAGRFGSDNSFMLTLLAVCS